MKNFIFCAVWIVHCSFVVSTELSKQLAPLNSTLNNENEDFDSF